MHMRGFLKSPFHRRPNFATYLNAQDPKVTTSIDILRGTADIEESTIISREAIEEKKGVVSLHHDMNEQEVVSSRHEKQNGKSLEKKRFLFAESAAASKEGLSKFHQSLLSPTIRRQRCVTGRYPLRITVQESPTRKWFGQLARGRDSAPDATSQLLVNGTSVDRSLASWDRLQWLDDAERIVLQEQYDMVSLELIAEIHVKKPGYVNLLAACGAGSTAAVQRAVGMEWHSRWKQQPQPPDFSYEDSGDVDSFLDECYSVDDQERLWITGFSLTQQSGEMTYVDVDSGYIGTVNERSSDAIRWPNEVNSVPNLRYKQTKGVDEVLADAILVSDGFLVPGRDQGGLYVVNKPGSIGSEWRICLTGDNNKEGWFYHRAVWVDLTGDGRKSILTARAKRPSLWRGKKSSNSSEAAPTKGQLVWLECPKPHSYDESTGNPLEVDGTLFDPLSSRHTPWKVRVLDEGPDVMFAVADLDTTDDSVEVIASQFFSKRLSLHSIRRGSKPHVIFRRTLDDRCGASFSSILADLDGDQVVAEQTRSVIDCGSTVNTLSPGDSFSHILVTSHECTFAANEQKVSSFQNKNPSGTRKGDKAQLELDVKTGGDLDAYTDTNSHTTESSTNTEAAIDGGSLFAYRVPSGKDSWKTQPWVRSVVATGFRVRGQIGNMINPGAP
eukprot:scaffold33112_cov45-Attheya_sp.AAC.1